MKREVFSTALLVFIGLGAAVVGGPEPGGNEMAITGVSGSAEATRSTGPNGTGWKTTVRNIQNSCLTGNQSTGINFGNFKDTGEFTSINFTGTVQTSTQCHKVTLEVSEPSENVYRMKIIEESSLNSTEMCGPCIGAARFEGSFAAKDDFKLKVFHEGEKIFEDSTSGYTPGQGQNETGGGSDNGRSGVWSVLSKIFGALFQ